MNEILMQIIINTIDFFANCNEEEANEDSAVKMLEEISYLIKQLNKNDKDIFIQYTKMLGDKMKGQDAEKAEFYYLIPENLGIT